MAGQQKLSPQPDHRLIARENIGARNPGMFAHVFASEDSSVASAPPTSRYVAPYPDPWTETVADAANKGYFSIDKSVLFLTLQHNANRAQNCVLANALT